MLDEKESSRKVKWLRNPKRKGEFLFTFDSDYLLNKSEYQADFSGSVEGVVFEWDVHNKIYYYGPSKWENNAKDVDLGRSIFSDSHEGLNIVMWFSFFLTYPEQYYADLFS